MRGTAVLSICSYLFLACAQQQIIPPAPASVAPPPSSSVVCSIPYERLVVMTATQNRAMDAKTGGTSGYSADDAAAEIVADELLRRGCRVVERQGLNAVLRERGGQQSGMVDQATAVRAGELAGAGAIVIANVYNTSQEHHQGHKARGGTGNTAVDTTINTGMPVINPSGMVYRVDISVKMIDVQTAEVVYAENKSKQSAPGEQTSYPQLLKDLVASLSFVPSPSAALSAEPQSPIRTPRRRKRRKSGEEKSQPSPLSSPPLQKRVY